MLQRLTQLLEPFGPHEDEIQLPFDQRQRARCRALSRGGDDVGIFVERGGVLREGDRLQGEGTKVYRVAAEPESLSIVRARSAHDLCRAAYHLGNRHVRLQVSEGYLAYQPDHVLDEMILGLGFSLEHRNLPFEPESGAYHRGAQGHSHDEHSHDHSHGSGPGHSHDHEHKSSDEMVMIHGQPGEV